MFLQAAERLRRFDRRIGRGHRRHPPDPLRRPGRSHEAGLPAGALRLLCGHPAAEAAVDSEPFPRRAPERCRTRRTAAQTYGLQQGKWIFLFTV